MIDSLMVISVTALVTVVNCLDRADDLCVMDDV